MKLITKIIILSIGILGTSLIFILDQSEKIGLCLETDYSCREWWDLISFGLLPISLLLLFSIITIWMKKEVFWAWFKFAVWYIPVLVAALFVFPTCIPGGIGIGGAYEESFNILVLIILFTAYIITSIVKILRAHKINRV